MLIAACAYFVMCFDEFKVNRFFLGEGGYVKNFELQLVLFFLSQMLNAAVRCISANMFILQY